MQAQHWDVKNAGCKLQITVDAAWVSLTIDAGKAERHRCRIDEYLRETPAPNVRTYREMVQDLAGLDVAREVQQAVRARLSATG